MMPDVNTYFLHGFDSDRVQPGRMRACTVSFEVISGNRAE